MKTVFRSVITSESLQECAQRGMRARSADEGRNLLLGRGALPQLSSLGGECARNDARPNSLTQSVTARCAALGFYAVKCVTYEYTTATRA